MEVEHRPLTEIRPYEKNPRINDAAVDAVAESIRQFGFRQPIVIDADGVIVCGHTRWKAAQKLGLDTVPVHVATDLTPEQIRAYRIADNSTNDMSDFAIPALRQELASIEFDMSMMEEGLAAQVTEIEIPIKPIEVRPLPALAWVLVGIPIERYDQLAPLIERAAELENVVIHTTIADEPSK
jgi:hypothetical protein